MPATTTLLKFLTECGVGSRRKLVDAIRENRVQVNGFTAEDFKQNITPGKDSITLDGRKVELGDTETVCLMLNKPAGIVTTSSDERGRRTVLDLLPEHYRFLRLYPVGRLDMGSTGLIILTNDGYLTYELTHPKFEHEKEYMVAIAGSLKPREKQKLQKGIMLSDGKTSPARIRSVRDKYPFNYSITIHEGKNRQVRRMFEELGHRVLALRRIRVGKLRLGSLPEGAVRKLSQQEIQKLLVK